MPVAPRTKRIKSAERVLQLLEYFNERRTEATVMDISRALALPQSSTSELLKCVTALGYLAYDPHRRSFRPTARVALLGAWVQPSLFRTGRLFSLMDELSAVTGEYVSAGMLVGSDVRHVHVVQPKKDTRLVCPERTDLTPHTAMGRILLAHLPTDAVRKFLHRHNAESEPRWRVAPSEYVNELAIDRERGYSLAFNTVWPNGGMVCAALPPTEDGQRLGVGIGGAAETIRQNEGVFSRLLIQTIQRYFAVAPPCQLEGSPGSSDGAGISMAG